MNKVAGGTFHRHARPHLPAPGAIPPGPGVSSTYVRDEVLQLDQATAEQQSSHRAEGSRGGQCLEGVSKLATLERTWKYMFDYSAIYIGIIATRNTRFRKQEWVHQAWKYWNGVLE